MQCCIYKCVQGESNTKVTLLAFTFLRKCQKDKEGAGFVLLFLSVLLSQECHLNAQWKVTFPWRGNKPQTDLILFQI